MSKEEKKKTNRVLEVLENGELINRTIEAFSTSMEKPMTEEQKEAMKKYATDMSEKWSEAILKFEKAIQDPAVQESLEKKLKNIKRTTSED
jgi:Tfp pilus assembly ATPase PilU